MSTTPINYLSTSLGATIKSCSSATPYTKPENLLLDTESSLWMTTESLPQFIIIDLRKLTKLPESGFAAIGLYCWHDYESNAAEVRLSISTAQNADFKFWADLALEQRDGVQIFGINRIPRDVKCLKIEVLANFGDSKTYINQLFLFEKLDSIPTEMLPKPRNQEMEVSDISEPKVFPTKSNMLTLTPPYLGNYDGQDSDMKLLSSNSRSRLGEVGRLTSAFKEESNLEDRISELERRADFKDSEVKRMMDRLLNDNIRLTEEIESLRSSFQTMTTLHSQVTREQEHPFAVEFEKRIESLITQQIQNSHSALKTFLSSQFEALTLRASKSNVIENSQVKSKGTPTKSKTKANSEAIEKKTNDNIITLLTQLSSKLQQREERVYELSTSKKHRSMFKSKSHCKTEVKKLLMSSSSFDSESGEDSCFN